MRQPRAPRPRMKNAAEAECKDFIMSTGLQITKLGWPYFFVWHPDGGIAVVEVKRKSTHRLKKSQEQVMAMLAAHGIACYKWTPDVGFIKIKPKERQAPLQPIHFHCGK